MSLEDEALVKDCDRLAETISQQVQIENWAEWLNDAIRDNNVTVEQIYRTKLRDFKRDRLAKQQARNERV